jgi:hypothetical protein
VKDAMGFLGLQTKNSNTLDKISATAKDAIFGSDISASFDSSTSVGTLYQFNKDGNNDNARLNLLASIDSDIDPNNPSVVKINQYVSFINSQTGRFSGTSGAIANEPDPVKKLDILKRDVNDLSILPSTCFGGYNIVNNSTLPT